MPIISRLQKQNKKLQEVFHFLDNCILSGSAQFFLLWQVYSSMSLRVSTSNLKILNLAKNEFF